MLSTQSGAMFADPARLKSRWGWFVAVGILFVVLGLIGLSSLVVTALATAVFLGFLVIIGGVSQFMGAFSAGSWGGGILRALLGLLYLWAGFWLIANPVAGALTITLVLAIVLIINGAIRIVAAIVEKSSGRWLLLLAGILSIVLGTWLWTNWPVSGIALGLFVGLELLIAGFTWIMLGFAARSLPDAAPAQPAIVEPAAAGAASAAAAMPAATDWSQPVPPEPSVAGAAAGATAGATEAAADATEAATDVAVDAAADAADSPPSA